MSEDPVRAIMATSQFRERVALLVDETGRLEADVRRDAEECLCEMTAPVSPRATAVWDRFGRWLSRSYEVDVEAAALPHLRELSANHSLVFLPNHRSYLDPLVLRRVLSQNGLPPNVILGGVNLAIWPFSEIAQRAGLVFIRRSTRDDPVYPEMLRLLLGHLLTAHDNLEWYFEGGRTRTGKLRPPKMGVLRYLVDAFTSLGADADDVLIVPVAIVYDQQHEVEAISEEEGGGSKRPESIGWLWSFARAQSRGRGGAHVRFGEPLSLRGVVDDAREPAAPINRDQLIAECLGVAHQRWLQRELHSPESISKDLMTNALRLADNRGLLSPGGDEVARARQAFADEVRETVRRVRTLRGLALERI